MLHFSFHDKENVAPNSPIFSKKLPGAKLKAHNYHYLIPHYAIMNAGQDTMNEQSPKQSNAKYDFYV